MDLNLQQLAGYSSPVQLGTTSSPEGGQSYRFSVDLKGYDPSTARVQGRWAADKFGSDILINGISTGQQTEATGFLAFTDFEITSGFDQGMNTIDFETDNEDDVAGLRVAGTVTARLYESILAPRQNLTMARAWTTLVSNQYDLLHYAPRVVPEPCGFETFVDVRHTDHERSTTPVEGASDYSANTTTVGASYGFCKGPVVTAQFGYTDAELDAEDSGRWDAESYNFAVRGDHNVGLLGRAYLFSLIISGGKGDSDSDRTSLLPTGEQVFADGVDAWNIMGMARVATTFEFFWCFLVFLDPTTSRSTDFMYLRTLRFGSMGMSMMLTTSYLRLRSLKGCVSIGLSSMLPTATLRPLSAGAPLVSLGTTVSRSRPFRSSMRSSLYSIRRVGRPLSSRMFPSGRYSSYTLSCC